MIPPLLFFVYMLYGIPLWLLYILVFIQLCKRSNQKYFNSSFFILATVQAFFDITGYINFTFEFRSPLTPLLGYLFADMQPSFFLSFSYFYRYFVQYTHFWLIAFTSINRLSALLYPSKHETFWNKGVWFCVGFALVISFILSWYFLFSTILVMEFTPGKIGYYVFIYTSSPIDVSSSLIELSVYAATGTITVTSNICCLGVLIRQNLKKSKTGSDKRDLKRYYRKAEIGLFAVTFGDFVVLVINIIIMINLSILMFANDYNNPLFDFWYLQIPWITDLSYLCRPILLITMSKNVRKVLIQSLLCTNAETHMNVTTITGSRSQISSNVTINRSKTVTIR